MNQVLEVETGGPVEALVYPDADEARADLRAALADEARVAPEPAAEETPVEAPPLVWVRDGIPDAQLHQVDSQKPGKTLCRLTLHAGRFRPASSTEVKTRRRCPQCSPAAPAPKRKGRRK